MKRIQLEIKALSPLAVGGQKPGRSVSEAEDYIPGTVIRGAIAAHILQEYRQQERDQQPDELRQDFSQNGGEFQLLFLSENPVIFQNAYPGTIEINKKPILLEEVRVVPATALSSRTKPGFKTPKGRGYGVFDTLLDRFCAEGYSHLYDPTCPMDGGRVDTFAGFYSKFNDKYYSPSASKRLLTRVGINRRRATSEEQVLYSIEVLNESPQDQKKKPAIFFGAILVPDAQLADSLRQFINSRSEMFRLGGSISRGLGRVKITAKEPINAKINIRARIEEFNQKLRKRWDDWKIFGNPVEELAEKRTYFTIDLQSDAILNEQWRRTTVISESMLEQFTGLTDSSLKLEMVYSSYDYRSGWNAAWGLMKDVELVTNKGAVYLFSTDKIDSWLAQLEELEIKGVGERTSEGFGQVQICNEFHFIFREKAK